MTPLLGSPSPSAVFHPGDSRDGAATAHPSVRHPTDFAAPRPEGGCLDSALSDSAPRGVQPMQGFLKGEASRENLESIDVNAHLLEPDEGVDDEQTGIDLNEGHSPPQSHASLGA